MPIQMILPAIVAKDFGVAYPQYLLIEPSPKTMREGILLAKAVIKPDISIIPVRVLNPLDVSTKLNKRIILGECSHITSIQETSISAKNLYKILFKQYLLQ